MKKLKGFFWSAFKMFVIYTVLTGTTLTYNPEKAHRTMWDNVEKVVGRGVSLVNKVKPIFNR